MKPVLYVDVDDTLVRSFGSKRLRELHPNECHGQTVDELLTSRGATAG